MTIKIAVVSDLHCHPMSVAPAASCFFSDGPRIPERDHPISSLAELIAKEKLSADILALPGDFTDKANAQGYVVGILTAREIAWRLGAPSIIASLGNHDVDSRGLAGPDHLEIARTYFPDFPIEPGNERERFFSSGFALFENESWRCLVVNSVHGHNTPEQADRGIVTEAQLEAIDRQLDGLAAKPFQFCLVHHHPIQHEQMGLGSHDLMEGGDLLLNLIQRHGFQLLIHGHKHHPRIRHFGTGPSSIVVFSSGSLSAVLYNRLARSARNTFHIIDLQSPNSTCARVHGIIRSWELSGDEGWVPSTYRSSGISHNTGFGCLDSLPDLATKIDAILEQQKVIKWKDACVLEPVLSFLTPKELEALSTELKTKNVDLSPDPREPVIAGRLI